MEEKKLDAQLNEQPDEKHEDLTDEQMDAIAGGYLSIEKVDKIDEAIKRIPEK